jgi:hypothetical protein
LALRYQLKVHGSKLSTEAAQSIESKCARLQDLIDAFQTRADFFLPHRHSIDDLPALLLTVDDVFDSAGEPLEAIEHADQITFDSFDHTSLRSLDGSGMSIFNPETFPILLPIVPWIGMVYEAWHSVSCCKGSKGYAMPKPIIPFIKFALI